MDRNSAYKTFWSEFVIKANQCQMLVDVHGKLSESATHQDQYLDHRYGNARTLFRYNVYWSTKYHPDYAFVMIDKIFVPVPHNFGPLKTMNKEHWQEVQSRMIEAMLTLAERKA